MAEDRLAVEIFGADNLRRYCELEGILSIEETKCQELLDLRQRASDCFRVDLTFPDIAVACMAGILLGLANALFKGWIPKHGPLAHKHSTTRTAIDYQIPTPEGFKGSVQDLHRQIGPTHDIARFKEALQIASGEKDDFKLWGSTATKLLNHELKPGNMSLMDFRNMGGFNIPSDPKKELLNHLLIDFFTKRSLPLPFSTYLADSSPEMARLMLKMYDSGLNLKTTLGNFIGFALVELVIHSYIFLFKATDESQFRVHPLEWENVKCLVHAYQQLIRKNEFHMMMMMSHGASFLVDALITCSSRQYSGIFELNYMSVLALGKHLLQYLIQNAKQYRELILQCKDKADEIGELERTWHRSLREAFRVNVNDSDFASIFDPNLWRAQTQAVARFQSSVRELVDRERELRCQLEG